ncbi:ribonuclease catalytic domain-containing protein [Corynebacterium hansenii]|uniref:Ribonuclease catalytic domain-containing protein n=1 Tax=Corynebacterium hansenii TaxID=394964 RepID=A0ABV7ZMW0_9CORY|nr:RNB domain-containing ribonuclease [Corynebacterium hansenii]WJZ00445.1 Ribonuclease R [Corynebacterium hansenii]
MKLYAAALDFRAVAREFGVPETFAPEVHADAAAAADRRASRKDMRDVPFVTIDPPGSMDLDQAMHLSELGGGGWRVLYAIADVGGLLDPDSPTAREAMRRGQTIYLPDEPTRLHPAALSEGLGSLLPDVDRPAIVWDIVVGADGEPAECDVYPALVRSVARLEYVEVQESFDAGEPHPSIAALPEVGRARQGSALRREAINLRLPSQTVAPTGDGRWELHLDARPPAMDHNSEISLLAGMVAGRMMAEAGVGVLRTLRPAGEEALAEFRVAARALGYDLPDDAGIAEVSAFLAGVDAESARGMAVMKDATRLLRGSGYERLGSLDDGPAADPSAAPVHSGVGGPYAHVTAPLRRLIDRFGLEYCLAIAAHRRGETETVEVPEWVGAGVDEAISTMATSGQLASRVDRACLDLTEAVVLEPWVGMAFDSAVLHDRGEEVEVFVFEPPVFATCRATAGEGVPAEGTSQRISLVTADPSNPLEPRVVFGWPAD